jgi:hypothetical protein
MSTGAGSWAVSVLGITMTVAAAGCSPPGEDDIDVEHRALSFNYTTPYGAAPVRAFIGLWDSKGNPYLVFQRQSDQACTSWLLGTGGVISNSHSIYLGPSMDYARILQTGASVTVTCTAATGGSFTMSGATQAPFTSQKGPTNITIHGGAGNDAILCNNNSDPSNNNTNSCFGDDGNDFVSADTATNMFLYGGTGDDKLYSPVSGPGLYMYGEDGDDCLQVGPGGTMGYYSCGPGTGDRSVGSFGIGCEGMTTACLGD